MRRERRRWDRRKSRSIVSIKIAFITEPSDRPISFRGKRNDAIFDFLVIQRAFEIGRHQLDLRQFAWLNIHRMPFLVLILIGQQNLILNTVILRHRCGEPLLQ